MSSWLERAYRKLLAAFPEEFRSDYETEMAQLFRDRYREEAGVGRLRFGLSAVGDVAFYASREHWQIMLKDFRQSIRRFCAKPGFAILGVVSLGLGIGLNASLFSVIYTMILSPFPYKNADRLVMMFTSHDHQGRGGLSGADLLDWQRSAKSFENLALFTGMVRFTMTGLGRAERITAQAVTPELFPILGVQAVVGRVFRYDDLTGQGGFAVISHGFWLRRFGGDPAVLGKLMRIDGEPRVIVGIMPQGFRVLPFQEEIDVWHSIDLKNPVWADRDHVGRWLMGMGKLKPGVSRMQAQEEMDGIAAGLEQQYPKTNLKVGVRVEKPSATMSDFMGAEAYPLMGAVVFVLMIACANVTNLLLANVSTRRRELSVRVAIGATRGRILREMLADGLVLSLPGAALGIGVAYLSLRMFNGYIRSEATAELNAPLLLSLCAMGVFTGVVVALIPGWQAARTDINEALKDGSRGTDGGGGTGFRGVLIVAEVALALILLVGAGLMIRTARSFAALDPGFDPSHVTMMRFDLSGPRYTRAAPDRPPNIRYVDPHVDQFIEQVTAQVRQLPGVESAGMAARAPRGQFEIGTLQFDILRHAAAAGELPAALVNAATADFLSTLRIPVLRGRGLTERDHEKAPWVVVINEAMAKRFWPKENPLGQFIQLHTFEGEQPREIVGIARDVPQFTGEATMPEVYTSYFQHPRIYPGRHQAMRSHPQLVVRSTENSSRVAEQVRGVVEKFDVDQTVLDAISMPEAVRKSGGVQDLYLWSLGMFAALALLLAAIGIYGLMSYTVSSRAHEMGIRMTLGADQKQILWLAMAQGMRLAVAGLAVGIGGALAAARLIERFLFGVKPLDPLTYAAVTGILAGVALFACYVPARRMLWLDPSLALRRE